MKIQKYKKNFDYSYALGMALTIELLKYHKNDVMFIYVHSSLTNEALDELKMYAGTIEIILNDKIFNILSKKENCYVIGVFKKYETKITNENHIVLHNPSNAGNLGTIIRSATGFNVKNIIIIRPGTDIFDPKVVRATMGALFHINFKYYDTFEEYQNEFKDHNLYPFMLQAKSSLKDVKFEKPFSLIFGNEATGLPREFLNIGHSVIIKHTNEIDSLNLPIACSIALFKSYDK